MAIHYGGKPIRPVDMTDEAPRLVDHLRDFYRLEQQKFFNSLKNFCIKNTAAIHSRKTFLPVVTGNAQLVKDDRIQSYWNRVTQRAL